MSYWGKIIGGTAGFFVGGPYGAVIGAALGHAADTGSVEHLRRPFVQSSSFSPTKFASLLGRRDEVFAISVTVLAARLSKCDGPVNRREIDAFKRHFRIPPESSHQIARLYDQARDNTEPFEPYAAQLAESFSDNRAVREQVLLALFSIARADAPLNDVERDFLFRVFRQLRLDQGAWDRALGERAQAPTSEADPNEAYRELGVSASASAAEIRAAWKKLVRENHPDSLAARGVPADFIARATDKVARINAAWDRVKRERGL